MTTVFEIKRDKHVEGVREIAVWGWDGRMILMPYTSFKRWRLRTDKEIKTAGVYLMYGDQGGNMGQSALYIGQANDVVKRIEQHKRSKKHTEWLLILTSKNDWMNIAHVRNIETELIEWAKYASRHKIINGNDSGAVKLGIDDLKRVRHFLLPLRSSLQKLGIDIFTPNLNSVFDRKEWNNGGHIYSKIVVSKYKSN